MNKATKASPLCSRAVVVLLEFNRSCMTNVAESMADTAIKQVGRFDADQTQAIEWLLAANESFFILHQHRIAL